MTIYSKNAIQQTFSVHFSRLSSWLQSLSKSNSRRSFLAFELLLIIVFDAEDKFLDSWKLNVPPVMELA